MTSLHGIQGIVRADLTEIHGLKHEDNLGLDVYRKSSHKTTNGRLQSKECKRRTWWRKRSVKCDSKVGQVGARELGARMIFVRISLHQQGH